MNTLDDADSVMSSVDSGVYSLREAVEHGEDVLGTAETIGTDTIGDDGTVIPGNKNQESQGDSAMKAGKISKRISLKVHGGDDIKGCDVLGADLTSTILNTLAEGVTKGYDAYSADSATADAAAQLKAAKANADKSVNDQADAAAKADAAYANALANLMLAQADSDKSKIAPAQTVTDMAKMSADLAGQGIAAEASVKRIKADRDAAQAAAVAAMNKPKDKYLQATMNAWQLVLTMANGSQLKQNYDPNQLAELKKKYDEASGMSTGAKVAIGVGVTGAVGGLGVLAYKFLFKKK